MNNYVPSHKAPLGGTLLGLMLVIGGGVGIGVLGFAVSQVINFIILFPLAMSLAAFFVHRFAFEKSRIRNRMLLLVFGIGIGVLAYGSYHYSNYRYELVQAGASLQDEYHLSPQEANRAINDYLLEETGIPGFGGYLRLTAREGINFTGHLMVSGTYLPLPGLLLKGVGAWLFWLFELLLTCSLPVMLSFEPILFCEKHQGLYGKPKQVGNVEQHEVSRFLGLLEGQQVAEAGELVLKGELLVHPTLEVYAQDCPGQGERDVLLTFKQTARSSGSRVTRRLLLRVECSAGEYARFSSRFRLAAEEK